MMRLTQLAKLARPLNNRLKSAVNFGDFIATNNVFARYASQRRVIDLPEKLVTNEERSQLFLTYDPQTNNLSLQLGDEQLGLSSSQTDSEDSKFCTYCNAPRCKIFKESAESGDNNEFVKSNENIVTITIDRDAFCRALCNSLGSRSINKKADNDAGEKGEYCSACKAPKCKLTTKSSIEAKADVDVRSKNPNKSKEGPGYCKYCDAPQCNLTAKTQNTRSDSKTLSLTKRTKYSDTDKSADNERKRSDDITKSPEYCAECKLPVCKYIDTNKTTDMERKPSDDITKSPQYCAECKLPVCKYIDTKKSTDIERKPSDDITKSPQYCAECKLPVCKYAADDTIQTGKDVTKAIGAAGSSDISIIVDAAAICGAICKDEKTSKKPSLRAIMAKTETSVRNKSPKSKNFLSSYDRDNSKI